MSGACSIQRGKRKMAQMTKFVRMRGMNLLHFVLMVAVMTIVWLTMYSPLNGCIDMLDRNKEALLALVRKYLWGHHEELPDADWEAVEKCAQEQGVLWMAYLGGKCFPQQIPTQRLKSWRTVLHGGVLNNDLKNVVQTELLEWLAEHNIRSAVLKGTSCSRYYPFPDARPLGDIDILIDKCNMNAIDAYLREKGYSPLQRDHAFHVGYYGRDAVVEVHYAGTDVPASRGGKIVAEEMDRFLDSAQAAFAGELTFPALSDPHQALMLLLHMERHMIESGIGLRQLCDWATFVKGSPSEHWQNCTLKLLEKCGLLTYAKAVTKVCVDYVGLDKDCAKWCDGISSKIAKALIEDVFRGGNMGASDQEGAGSLFTERKALGQKGQSLLKGYIARMNKISFKHWPITEKYRILLPFCWVYIPLRYMMRSKRGLRPKKEISYIVSAAEQRRRLYSALELYEVKK